jgi:hypothetical protein
MAKGPFLELLEQHVEKILLGVCLLLLLVAVGYWGLASRRTVELPGTRSEKKATPAEVDRQLQELAKTVASAVEAKKPDVPPPPNYIDQFHLLTTGASPGKPLSMEAFGTPARPIGATEGPAISKIDLKELLDLMPAPGKPLVDAVRILPNRPMERATDEMVAHVAAVYPWQPLADAWRDRLRNSGVPSTPVAIGVVAQVQERMPDGNWSPPKEVTTVFQPTLDAQSTPIPLPQVPAYDGTNAGYLARLRGALSEPAWQSYVLEPNYWQVWWPGYGWTDWRVNLPENEITKEAAAALAQGGGTGAPGTPQAAAPRVRTYVNQYGETETIEEGQTPPSGAPVPGQPLVPAQLSAQIPPPKLPVVPDISQQMQAGMVLVWFHDGSLQPLTVYRYRLAVKFLNPLLGFDNVVKETACATEPAVTTPFSEWSDRVEVPQPTEFFLVAASESAGEMKGKVTVFTRSTGQQVKERFNVVPGQIVGQVKDIQLTNPADGSVGMVPVDFSTGAIAVEFRLSRYSAGGRNVVEMLYLDEKGNLQTKVNINSLPRTDREYQRYKELEQKEKVTRLAAEAARAATQPALTPGAPPAREQEY